MTQAGRGTVNWTPPSHVQEWLARLGYVGHELTPADARRWGGVWRYEHEHRMTGQRPLRPRPSPAHRLGRRRLHPTTRLQAVRDAQGVLQTDPTLIEGILWRNRAPVWGSVPAAPGHGQCLLDHYFREKRVQLPAAPPVDPDLIAGHLLRERGGPVHGWNSLRAVPSWAPLSCRLCNKCFLLRPVLITNF